MSDTVTLDRQTTRSKVDYRIIDADQHLNPPHDFWKDYLPANLQHLAPYIESAEDADYLIFEGSRRKINIMHALAGVKAKDFKMEGRVKDFRRGSFDPAGRIEDMDMDGVDVAVIYGGGPLGTANKELFLESFNAYNRFVMDFALHDRARLCPVGYIPMVDVVDSVARLKVLAKMGFTVINIPAYPFDLDSLTASGAQVHSLTGNMNAEKLYDDPMYDPFWAAAVEHDIALTFHLGGRVTRFTNKQRILADMLASKFAMAETPSTMIFGGVFDRFPGLKIGTIESGGGWLAFAADYMDRTWEKQRFWTESTLKNPPSFYMAQNIYASFIHDRVAIETCHLPGAKNVMWSSDYPHSETTFPESQDWIERLFKGISEQDKKMILCDTAEKFFRV